MKENTTAWSPVPCMLLMAFRVLHPRILEILPTGCFKWLVSLLPLCLPGSFTLPIPLIWWLLLLLCEDDSEHFGVSFGPSLSLLSNISENYGTCSAFGSAFDDTCCMTLYTVSAPVQTVRARPYVVERESLLLLQTVKTIWKPFPYLSKK